VILRHRASSIGAVMGPNLDYSQIAELYDPYVVFEGDIPFFAEACRGP
jgi:hypothetical protein